MRMRVGFNTEVTAFDIVNYGPFYTEEGVGKEQRANVRKVHDALSRYFMERRSVLPETRRGNASHPGHLPSTTLNSPQEPASPSPSTPSSGSPPPDENISHSTALSSSHQLPSPGQIKRRLVSGSAVYGRDLKSRRRDETSAKKPFVQEHSGRENRKEELVDIDLMEKLKLGSFNTF